MTACFNRAIVYRPCAILILLIGICSSANAQTIKLATIAPEGSAWMDAMRAGAKEISDRTEARVKFKFYGGGVQGNDKQVMRKMRIGQLHGGAFTSNALGLMQKNAQLYALPMMFSNLDEVKYVRERMDDKLRIEVEQAGYINFGFAGGGFANIMSNKPIRTLTDMQDLKVWVPDGDRLSYGAVEALGISPVTMPLTDVLTGLQTELIDTIISPPSGAIVLQWNTAVSYITELPLAYIFAMLVIEKRVFDRLQASDQAIVREVMEGVYRGFDEQGIEDNTKAFQALLDDGMEAVAPDNGQVGAWRSAVRESNHKLAAEGAIDIGLLNEIECHINAYREGKLENSCTQ